MKNLFRGWGMDIFWNHTILKTAVHKILRVFFLSQAENYPTNMYEVFSLPVTKL